LGAAIIWMCAYVYYWGIVPIAKGIRSSGKRKIDDYRQLELFISEGYLIIEDKIELSKPSLELALGAVCLFSHLNPRIFLDTSNYDKTLILLRHPIDSTRVEAILTSDEHTIELANQQKGNILYKYQGLLGQ
jgi:hypothetical protein